jgi:glycosyltransferase involved in cell wall biosynthesis
MPKISVIIPAYNAERTLQETVESVQNQTFSDFEIIIINDGSTDQTLTISQNFVDPRVKIFSYQNAGVSVARNRGIANAMGEFIAFIDADDLWTPDKLERQLKALSNNSEAGVAYSWTQTIDERGKPLPHNHPVFLEGSVYADLLVSNFIANGSNILVRREVISQVGEFDADANIRGSEDWDYYLRLAAETHFTVVPDWQILYRQSSTSVSSNFEMMEASALAVVKKAYQSAPLEYQHLKNKSLAWVYGYSTQQALQRKDDWKNARIALRKFCKAVQLHPQFLLEDYGQSLVRWLIKRLILSLATKKGSV